MISTEIVDNLSALEPIASEWNRLGLEAPLPTPFLSHAWTAAYLEHRLEPGESWFCVLAREAGVLVGVLPLVVTPLRVPGLELAALRAPVDKHTFTGDALLSPGRQHEVLSELIRTAAEHYPRHLYIELPRVPAASRSLIVGEQPLAGRLAAIRARGQGAYLPIQGSFEAYRAGLSGNFRSNLNKAANKLKKLPKVRERFLVGAEATIEMLPRFMAVEARSWKGDQGSAILKSPELVEFYTTLCRRLADAGWLEWQLLDTGERTIAANLAIRMGRTTHIWKLGYDADFANCSPGGMLLERLIERCYDTGEIDEISLLTNQPWYERWQMQQRPYYGVRLYPQRPAAWVARALDGCVTWVAEQPRLRQAWTRLRPAT